MEDWNLHEPVEAIEDKWKLVNAFVETKGII